MTDKKSQKTFLIIAGIVVAVILVALFIVTPAKKTNTGQDQPIAPAETSAITPPAAETAPTESASTEPTTSTTTETPAVAAPPATLPSPTVPPSRPANAKPNIDANAALSDRILGDTSAPVKISEHASLTCPHCGKFDKDVFEKIKKNYIDTKKAYWVFSDFPLNQPAFEAAMIARCLPDAKYFAFIHMLFLKQDEWANSSSYLSYLKEKAAKEGMDGATVDACLDNKDLKEGMTNRMKAVANQWHINSTPSFVFNNKTVVSGDYPYDAFAKLIDNEVAKRTGAAPAQEATPAPAPATAEEPKAEVKTEPKAAEKPAAKPASKGDADSAQ